MRIHRLKPAGVLPVVVGALFSGITFAAGEVTTISTMDDEATPSRYTLNGQTYTWGMGRNQVMDGFSANGTNYGFVNLADRVELKRSDVHDVSNGNPCGVFVERVGPGSDVLSANYPSDGSNTGNCDMAAMLASNVVNRGALNLFSNTGENPKNVERVDYIFDRGQLAPMTQHSLNMAGHVVAEKSGNNPLQIAAITSLNILGEPAGYGTLVLVDRNGCSDPAICYGLTNLHHNYSFFQNNSTVPPPQGYPEFLKDSTETVGMAFVSLAQLGLTAGQLYYGFSYFPDDVDAAVHTLTDHTSFPDNTNDEQIIFGDGPDIYGGVSGFFVADNLSNASGSVFKDENGDGQLNGNEAGISDIGLSLYQDTNLNGVFDPDSDTQIGLSFNTQIDGSFFIPGLEDGAYFLLLDESDDDLPPGIAVVPGTNPAAFVIDGADESGILFQFIDVNAGETDTGGTTAGADAGGTDAGGADAGGADAGGTDTGGTDTGGTDTGGTDTGGTDTGGTDTGGTDTGGTDTTGGATDQGTTDDGFIIINDGENPTKANPDSVSVNQGQTEQIPVLANDVDAAGSGLTIVSVSESPNATININGQVIEYTSNYGFIGTDTFLYVIEDGEGVQSTGTVDVNVLRYSDINSNGLNDFVECNCDNLTIEVGVEGSALGASSALYILLLSLFAFIRRVTQSRVNSKLGVQL
jgi:hypothetical protein